DRNRGDSLLRFHLLQSLNGGGHCCAGREAVVNDDHGLISYIERWSPLPIELLTAFQLLLFAHDYCSYELVGHSYSSENPLVKDHHPSASERSKSELLLSGNAEFSDDKDIKGCV